MSPTTELTPQDREFLRRPLHGLVTAAAGSVPPQPRPVWFELADDDTVVIFSAPDSARVRHLQQDPRASVVVVAPVGEPEHWVAVSGPVTLSGAGDERDLVTRLGARYYDLGDADRAAAVESMAAQEWVRIVIHPEKVRRVTY